MGIIVYLNYPDISEYIREEDVSIENIEVSITKATSLYKTKLIKNNPPYMFIEIGDVLCRYFFIPDLQESQQISRISHNVHKCYLSVKNGFTNEDINPVNVDEGTISEKMLVNVCVKRHNAISVLASVRTDNCNNTWREELRDIVYLLVGRKDRRYNDIEMTVEYSNQSGSCRFTFSEIVSESALEEMVQFYVDAVLRLCKRNSTSLFSAAINTISNGGN